MLPPNFIVPKPFEASKVSSSNFPDREPDPERLEFLVERAYNVSEAVRLQSRRFR